MHAIYTERAESSPCDALSAVTAHNHAATGRADQDTARLHARSDQYCSNARLVVLHVPLLHRRTVYVYDSIGVLLCAQE